MVNLIQLNDLDGQNSNNEEQRDNFGGTYISEPETGNRISN